MTEQPDLFALSAAPAAAVSSHGDAVMRRDKGMHRSAAHAERCTPEWQERAIGYVRLFATVHGEFLCEDVRAMAEIDGFTPPPDKRSWGHAMVAAAKRGIIEANGYAPAASSNLSPKRYWRSLIQETAP